MSDRAPVLDVEVVNFGCRLNAVESEVIRRDAGEAGLRDTVVFNTCAVTAEAVSQARQTIRKMRRARPNAALVVTGCAVHTDGAAFAAMPEVDRVLGNREKLAPGVWSKPSDRVAVSDIMAETVIAPHRLDASHGTRAFVQIQNGCDHRCTFCIIPFGRGRSRSLAPQDVIAQVRTLVDGGHREVVLTGVDLTSYEFGLGRLVRDLLRGVPELARLRLSSIDSVEVDDELLAAIAEETRLMPHLHLSLQAGDDLILKRMKRRHLRADAIEFCARVRSLRPDMVFGADLIAGFPTETDEMFQRSLDLVEECALTHLHVFPFSPRPGTPAARMPQVARDVSKDRARRLRLAGDAALRRHLEGEVGRTRRVLAEAGGIGRTEDFTLVRLSQKAERGQFVDVTITGHDGKMLHAH